MKAKNILAPQKVPAYSRLFPKGGYSFDLYHYIFVLPVLCISYEENHNTVILLLFVLLHSTSYLEIHPVVAQYLRSECVVFHTVRLDPMLFIELLMEYVLFLVWGFYAYHCCKQFYIHLLVSTYTFIKTIPTSGTAESKVKHIVDCSTHCRSFPKSLYKIMVLASSIQDSSFTS